MTGEECMKLLDNEMADVAGQNEIVFKFAVGTEYGICRVLQHARQKGLSRMALR
ncbi:MAG: hypothetical protein MN733_01210 [Nitrososphaera sp.]|nr:hypothetical protein [Nitrososphaera sp.]